MGFGNRVQTPLHKYRGVVTTIVYLYKYMHNLRDKLIKVHDRLQHAAEQAKRDIAVIRLLAVSKTQPAAKVRELFECGQQCFGENYVQEALQKQQALQDLSIEWHFIGPIQSNKTQAIAQNFSWVHSIDRLKIAQRLNDQRSAHLPPLNVCLQINTDDEQSKSGVSFDQLETLAGELLNFPQLRLRGLMAIPAPRHNFEQQVAVFQRVRAALNALKQKFPAHKVEEFDTLSMGMSADLEAAVFAGATMVRVGTDLFGARE